ncbi:trimethylamine-N-oxide reductase (cytochrome c), cytochrome c-type subunit TorC [Pseudovibrio ascidiaceicola]|uniref:Cytochrome c-type protein n=1 Tax=Pseudovibrio ascidiaceicola TaxID=285279 RepID=A0A1I3Y3R7_9HYPH|nr:NapC/NirT family cytochrome c [Pseudovibrio ascidiaceicola]SFK25906.1 trimethylamine-N-oxide reductase (cytochrome c), cytochrome c-type subunit TorC [Pseudovibrio ascidiaceicola]
MIKRLWQHMWAASPLPLAALIIAGGIGGVIFWGGFNTAMEVTNSLEFCTSCHEMQPVYQEYKTSVHYQNNSGVRAECPDCHVPKEWGPKIIRKIQASNELYHKFIAPSIDTPEKFEANRLRLAKHVWQTMKETDSRECRNCHSFETMKIDGQREKAQKMHPKAIKEGSTCIDCHKGIAHKLPDLSAASKQAFEMLKEQSKTVNYNSSHLTTLATASIYLNDEDSKAAGRVLPATTVEPVDSGGKRVKVKVSGWSQKGAEKIIYAMQGQRIFNTALSKTAVPLVDRGETITLESTGQEWTAVSFTGFMDKKNMISEDKALWSYAGDLYENSCSVCHNAPSPSHFMANQWIGVLKSMVRYTALSKDEQRLLQRYLQLNAQDTGGKGKH